jgi:chromate reductase, NAD(P)H dehydrogenase (quinone)
VAARNIAVIVGSLRKESFNRKLANTVIAIAPESLHMSIVPIGDLPLYNQDLETDSPPAQWIAFRDAIRSADALLFVTPEYNRSIPGGLKNAIDVGSRPIGKSVWSRKPAAVISVTAGALGAMAANFALRQTLAGVNVATMPGPEAFIAQAATLFGPDGKLTNDSTVDFLRKFLDAFVQWIERNAPPPRA